jgi:hypothetical protein
MDWNSVPQQLIEEAQQLALLEGQDFSTLFHFEDVTSSVLLNFPGPALGEAPEIAIAQANPVVTIPSKPLKRLDSKPSDASETPVEALKSIGPTFTEDTGSLILTARSALPVTETPQTRRTRRETKPREHVSNPYGRKGNKRCANCRKWRQKVSSISIPSSANYSAIMRAKTILASAVLSEE